MSDRIAVMNAGKVEQVGAPSEIYDRPRTRFVADFIGEINLFEGAWSAGRFVMGKDHTLPAVANGTHSGSGIIAVRPEKTRLVGEIDGALGGRIETANFLGGQVLYRVVTDEGRAVLAKEQNVGTGGRKIGDRVGVAWMPSDAVSLEA